MRYESMLEDFALLAEIFVLQQLLEENYMRASQLVSLHNTVNITK
jgi:hypothetical protein